MTRAWTMGDPVTPAEARAVRLSIETELGRPARAPNLIMVLARVQPLRLDFEMNRLRGLGIELTAREMTPEDKTLTAAATA